MKIDLKKYDFQSDKVLGYLTPNDHNLFIQKGKRLVFKKQELIFSEGKVPRGIFLMEQGRAKVYQTGLLKEFREEKLIIIDKRAIYLNDTLKLQRIANSESK